MRFLVLGSVLICFIQITVGTECPEGVVRRVASKSQCDRYYECSGGRVFPKVCRAGLCFSAKLAKCKPCPEVSCPQLKCPKPSGRFPLEGKCSLYLSCFRGEPHIFSCLPGTMYHPKMKGCVPASYFPKGDPCSPENQFGSSCDSLSLGDSSSDYSEDFGTNREAGLEVYDIDNDIDDNSERQFLNQPFRPLPEPRPPQLGPQPLTTGAVGMPEVRPLVVLRRPARPILVPQVPPAPGPGRPAPEPAPEELVPPRFPPGRPAPAPEPEVPEPPPAPRRPAPSPVEPEPSRGPPSRPAPLPEPEVPAPTPLRRPAPELPAAAPAPEPTTGSEPRPTGGRTPPAQPRPEEPTPEEPAPAPARRPAPLPEPVTQGETRPTGGRRPPTRPAPEEPTPEEPARFPPRRPAPELETGGEGRPTVGRRPPGRPAPEEPTPEEPARAPPRRPAPELETGGEERPTVGRRPPARLAPEEPIPEEPARAPPRRPVPEPETGGEERPSVGRIPPARPAPEEPARAPPRRPAPEPETGGEERPTVGRRPRPTPEEVEAEFGGQELAAGRPRPSPTPVDQGLDRPRPTFTIRMRPGGLPEVDTGREPDVSMAQPEGTIGGQGAIASASAFASVGPEAVLPESSMAQLPAAAIRPTPPLPPRTVIQELPQRIDIVIERPRPVLQRVSITRTSIVTQTRTLVVSTTRHHGLEDRSPVLGTVTVTRRKPVFNTVFIDRPSTVRVTLEHTKPVFQTITMTRTMTVDNTVLVPDTAPLDVAIEEPPISISTRPGTTAAAFGGVRPAAARRPGADGGVMPITGRRPSSGASAQASAAASVSARSPADTPGQTEIDEMTAASGRDDASARMGPVVELRTENEAETPKGTTTVILGRARTSLDRSALSPLAGPPSPSLEPWYERADFRPYLFQSQRKRRETSLNDGVDQPDADCDDCQGESHDYIIDFVYEPRDRKEAKDGPKTIPYALSNKKQRRSLVGELEEGNRKSDPVRPRPRHHQKPTTTFPKPPKGTRGGGSVSTAEDPREAHLITPVGPPGEYQEPKELDHGGNEEPEEKSHDYIIDFVYEPRKRREAKSFPANDNPKTTTPHPPGHKNHRRSVLSIASAVGIEEDSGESDSVRPPPGHHQEPTMSFPQGPEITRGGGWRSVRAAEGHEHHHVPPGGPPSLYEERRESHHLPPGGSPGAYQEPRDVHHGEDEEPEEHHQEPEEEDVEPEEWNEEEENDETPCDEHQATDGTNQEPCEYHEKLKKLKKEKTGPKTHSNVQKKNRRRRSTSGKQVAHHADGHAASKSIVGHHTKSEEEHVERKETNEKFSGKSGRPHSENHHSSSHNEAFEKSGLGHIEHFKSKDETKGHSDHPKETNEEKSIHHGSVKISEVKGKAEDLGKRSSQHQDKITDRLTHHHTSNHDNAQRMESGLEHNKEHQSHKHTNAHQGHDQVHRDRFEESADDQKVRQNILKKPNSKHRFVIKPVVRHGKNQQTPEHEKIHVDEFGRHIEHYTGIGRRRERQMADQHDDENDVDTLPIPRMKRPAPRRRYRRSPFTEYQSTNYFPLIVPNRFFNQYSQPSSLQKKKLDEGKIYLDIETEDGIPAHGLLAEPIKIQGFVKKDSEPGKFEGALEEDQIESELKAYHQSEKGSDGSSESERARVPERRVKMVLDKGLLEKYLAQGRSNILHVEGQLFNNDGSKVAQDKPILIKLHIGKVREFLTSNSAKLHLNLRSGSFIGLIAEDGHIKDLTYVDDLIEEQLNLDDMSEKLRKSISKAVEDGHGRFEIPAVVVSNSPAADFKYAAAIVPESPFTEVDVGQDLTLPIETLARIAQEQDFRAKSTVPAPVQRMPMPEANKPGLDHCRYYLICQNGRPIVKMCPDNLVYCPVRRKCITPAMAQLGACKSMMPHH